MIQSPPQRRWLRCGRSDQEDKTFFFGGYQRTQASTAFVPTARAPVLARRLATDHGARTRKMLAAFSQLNPDRGQYSKGPVCSSTDALISDRQ